MICDPIPPEKKKLYIRFVTIRRDFHQSVETQKKNHKILPICYILQREGQKTNRGDSIFCCILACYIACSNDKIKISDYLLSYPYENNDYLLILSIC